MLRSFLLTVLFTISQSRVLDGPLISEKRTVSVDSITNQDKRIVLRDDETLQFSCKSHDMVLYEVDAWSFSAVCGIPLSARLVVDCSIVPRRKVIQFQLEDNDNGEHYFVGVPISLKKTSRDCNLLKFTVQQLDTLPLSEEDEEYEYDEQEPKVYPNEKAEDLIPLIKKGSDERPYPIQQKIIHGSVNELPETKLRHPHKDVMFIDVEELREMNEDYEEAQPDGSSTSSILVLIAFVILHLVIVQL